MDIRKQLLLEHSKENTMLVVDFIGSNPERFAILMDLFLNDTYRVTQRAAWVVGHAGKNQIALVQPYLEQMILHLKKPNLHDAIKRNIVRILQDIEIPESLWGEAADICFRFLASHEEPVAIKVFSMTVLHNITKKVPELREELAILIEDQMPYGSAGFKSRGKKILKALQG